jgi:hypothetical protein
MPFSNPASLPHRLARVSVADQPVFVEILKWLFALTDIVSEPPEVLSNFVVADLHRNFD